MSKIARDEERGYVKRVVVEPTADLTPTEQHAIRAVIREFEAAMPSRP